MGYRIVSLMNRDGLTSVDEGASVFSSPLAKKFVLPLQTLFRTCAARYADAHHTPSLGQISDRVSQWDHEIYTIAFLPGASMCRTAYER